MGLMSCPPHFHNFKWSYINAVAAYHPTIQKEVDELLAKGAKEPSSGGAGFYPNVFLFLSIPMASSLYITISSLIIICTFPLLRCLLSDMFQNVFNIVIMLSPFISRMFIYIFLLLSIIIIFHNLFGKICHITGKVYLWCLCYDTITDCIIDTW